MNKKTIIASALLAFNILTATSCFSQGMAVNTTGTAADSSAIFDASSSNKGLLLPRLTTAERNAIISPAQSLLIFNTSTKCFEYYANNIWQTISCSCNPPAAADAISGLSNICQGQNAVYTVPAIANATSYTWSYSGAGATIVGSSNTVIIYFSGNATAGNLTVMGTSACGNGAVSANFPITINSLPDPAGTIGGTASVCQGQTGVNYSVPLINNATSYTWSFSGTGAAITGSTNSVLIDFSSSATSGNLTVRGTNGCGSGNVSANYAITLSSASTAPTGASASLNPLACGGNPTTLTVSGGSPGSGASWKWYSGSCGVTLAGTGSSITVSPNSSTTYYVRAEGNCNTTTCANITLTVTESVATSSGLAGCWKFTGNANDGSGNGNNGTVNGATLTTDRFGNSNSAYSFNGTTDWINCGTGASLNITGPVTVCAWIKTSATHTNAGIAGRWNANGGSGTEQHVLRPGTDITFFVKPSGGQIGATATGYSDNTWHFFVGVWTGSAAKIYKDGTFVASTAGSGTMGSFSQPFEIGRYAQGQGGTQNYFTGIIDDVRVYNRALNNCEILRLYNEPDASSCGY